MQSSTSKSAFVVMKEDFKLVLSLLIISHITCDIVTPSLHLAIRATNAVLPPCPLGSPLQKPPPPNGVFKDGVGCFSPLLSAHALCRCGAAKINCAIILIRIWRFLPTPLCSTTIESCSGGEGGGGDYYYSNVGHHFLSPTTTIVTH